MRNIIVVEAVSTGYNFVEDIYRRGYNPVILEPLDSSDDIVAKRRTGYELLYRLPEIIKEADSFEETVELVRSFDPVLVIAGSENGVPLATHLADELGLPGNPWKNIDKMINKDAMQKALEDAGIRSIKGRIVKSPEEALEFCRENGFTTAVVKPLRGAGSQGLFLCDDLDEVSSAVSEVLSMKNFFGNENREVLVQERIVGTEHIVNTASCDGMHRVTSVLRYRKVATPEGAYIYDYMENVMRLEPGHGALIEYALKVADAIGIKYGMIHGEYMLDKNGPVLIEVNCRPIGGTQPAEYMDMIFGQHETDSMLDSMLDPEKFKRDAAMPYRPKRKAVLKFIMVPNEMDVEDHPVWVVAKRLRSVFSLSAEKVSTPKHYFKTRDVESSGGMIFMVHDDENVVLSELSFLRRIEKSFFQFLLNEGMSRPWFKREDTMTDFSEVIRRNGCCGSILLATDTPERKEGMQVVSPDTLSDAKGGFDYVIMGYQNSLVGRSESDLLELLFDTIDQVREGGRVIIPPEIYRYFSYGRKGAELLLSIGRCTLEAPVQGAAADVVATRESL